MKPRFHVYFGGSYFPPHLGHDEMLVSLLKNPDVAFVHLVPTFQNPLKQVPSGSRPTPALKHRLIEAWVASLKKRQIENTSKLRVEWIELDAAQPSYTVESLVRLQSNEAEADWALCVGDDCLPDLDRWKEIDRLLKKVKEVWVFARGPRNGKKFLGDLPERLRASTYWRLMPAEILDVSSSQIRQIIESYDTDARQERLKPFVLPDVLAVLGDSSDRL